jgi:hypothetical protein
MTHTNHIDFVNFSIIQLIRHIDNFLRSGYGLMRIISSFILGIVLTIILIPVFASLFVILTFIARAALSYLSHQLKKGIKEVSELEDERELMELGPQIIEIKTYFEVIIRSLGTTKKSKLYKSLVFGDLLAKCNDQLQKMLNIIDESVYPHLNEAPDQEQLKRLIKEYEGISLSLEDI